MRSFQPLIIFLHQGYRCSTAISALKAQTYNKKFNFIMCVGSYNPLTNSQQVNPMKILAASILSLLSFSALAAPEGTLSVHILNQQTGLPSQGVVVELDKQESSSWKHLATSKTDTGGRIKSLFPDTGDMEPGIYKVTFKVGDYFKANNQETFFPSVPVIFNVTKTNQKLHIPLLLSQYGYSTYRGS